MKKSLKITCALIACAGLFIGISSPVKAADMLSSPSVSTTIQNVQYGFNPGKIILPFGATLTINPGGSYTMLFLDNIGTTLSAAKPNASLPNGFNLSLKNGSIAYTRNVNGSIVNASFNLSTLVTTVISGNVTAYYKNGSILTTKVTTTPTAYSIESYDETGKIYKNDVYTPSGILVCSDDYLKTPGMIVRTTYNALGQATSILPYYGNANPAY